MNGLLYLDNQVYLINKINVMRPPLAYKHVPGHVACNTVGQAFQETFVTISRVSFEYTKWRGMLVLMIVLLRMRLWDL